MKETLIMNVYSTRHADKVLTCYSHFIKILTLFAWILEKVVYGAKNFEDEFSFGHEIWMLF